MQQESPESQTAATPIAEAPSNEQSAAENTVESTTENNPSNNPSNSAAETVNT